MRTNIMERKREWTNMRVMVALAGIIVGHEALAAGIRVPDDYSTIQAALNAATPGDEIIVGAGVYSENLAFGGKAISLRSIDGPAQTVVQGAGGTVVNIGPGGEFIGFTVRNGMASFGAGMAVKGTGTIIRDNIFEDNTQSAGGFGAAIGGNGSSPVIEQNIFRANSCDSQYLSGVVAFVNSSSPRIANNVFENNSCRAINMTVPSSARPLVVNNTIVGNRVGIHVDRRAGAAQQIYRNNIIVGNEIGLEIVFGIETYNPTWTHNLVYGNGNNYQGILDKTGQLGNMSIEPLFVDQSGRDYHLRGNSPAVDAGTNSGAPLADFEGDPRPEDGNGDGVALSDIGADEFSEGVVIETIGGAKQECLTTGGTTVRFVAHVTLQPGAEIASIGWLLDGEAVGWGDVIDLHVPVGDHSTQVKVTTTNKQEYSTLSPVSVVDTIAPQLEANFVDSRTGQTVTQIDVPSVYWVTVRYVATDVCDANPVTAALVGVPAADGSTIKVQGTTKALSLTGSSAELAADAIDASGNRNQAQASLLITD